MYRRDFLDRHRLRFPEGIHYEDQLFSAQAYCLAKAFTIVPEPVYVWYIEPFAAASAASISNQRDRISNVRDRVGVQRLIDDFLLSSGHEGLREDKDFKFLKHDFRMYAGDLPYRDDAWLTSFAEIVNPYLDTLSPGAYGRLPRDERVVLELLRQGRTAEVRLAARGLGHQVAPRRVTTDGAGVPYWGETPPATERARRELDLSELELDTRPFPAARFRHEITDLTFDPGAALTLTIRTYDPGLRLPVGPQRASLLLTPGRRRMTVPFRLDPVRPGVFTGTVRLELASASLPVQGFDGYRHPLIRLEQQGLANSSVLLAPPDFATRTARVPHHTVTVEPEPRSPGRLQIRWRPVGTTARVLRPMARRVTHPRLRNAARLVASVLK